MQLAQFRRDARRVVLEFFLRGFVLLAHHPDQKTGWRQEQIVD
jgi:hypothetical protein